MWLSGVVDRATTNYLPLHFICLGCSTGCLPCHELFRITYKLSYYFFIVNVLCKVYQLSLFLNLFIVLWHLLVLMVAALNLHTLDHILHKLVSIKKKKKAFGEIVYAVTQQVQMNLIFTNKCLYIIVILQCQKVQNNCSMYLWKEQRQFFCVMIQRIKLHV